MFYSSILARTIVLAAFVVGHIGFPVLDVHPVTTGGAFPCQGHNCGCQSADHCWHSCCCLSLGERLAWAEKNGVEAPVSVRHQAAESQSSPTQVAVSCCAEAAPKADCRLAESDNPVDFRWITALKAMKCRGHTSYWSLAAEPAIATNIPLAIQFDLPVLGKTVVIDEFCEHWGSAPSVPPG